uniref:TPR_REGION domain-containing protein n=1 Tax=Macrostomum lignano TaxID=282301 RepID=A0A1I8IWU3_9PLAT
NGDDHAKALENYTAKQLLKRRNTGFVQGLFRAALLEIESPRSMSTRDNIRRVLPSTGESALFTVLCDVQLIRSMGCVLLVARDKNGQPIAVPVESSVSYSDIKFKKADSDELAKQFIEDLRQASVPLNSLVGVVTEGYYSADASDAAAALNDTVENNRCGLAYRCEDRAHKFECLHWHVDLPDTASPDCNRHYALNIYYEFEALATHYDKFYEVYHWRSQKYEGEFNNRDKRDMFGSDFVADLLMTNCLTGSSVCCLAQLPATWLSAAAEFRIELYPTGGFDSIRPGGSYLGVPLVQGWNVGETPFTFDSEGPVDQKLLRSQADIERDVTEFAAALHRSFVQQVESYSASAPSIVNDAAVMDAGQILCLLASSDASAEVEALARSAAAERLVLAAAQHRQMSLVSTASVASYATAIQRAFISGDGREGWTTPCITGRIVKVELEPAEREGEFATCLRVTTESSDEAVSVRLNEDFIYKSSLYFDPRVFGLAGRDGCLLLDFALHVGGTHGFAFKISSMRRSQEKREPDYRHCFYAPEQEKKEDEAALKLRTKLGFMLLSNADNGHARLLDEVTDLFFDEERREEVKKGSKVDETENISKIQEKVRRRLNLVS